MGNETCNISANLEDLRAFYQFRKDHPTIRCDQCHFSEKLYGKPDNYFLRRCAAFAGFTFTDCFCGQFVRKEDADAAVE